MVKEIMTKAWEISACVEALPKTASGKAAWCRPLSPPPLQGPRVRCLSVWQTPLVLGDEQTTQGALEVSLGPVLPRADRSPPHPPTEGPPL